MLKNVGWKQNVFAQGVRIVRISYFCNRKRIRFTFMRHKELFLLIWMLLLVMSACKEEEEHLPPIPYSVLVSIDKTEEVTFNETIASLQEEYAISDEKVAPYKQTLNMAALRSRVYRAYVIKYHTTDPNGHPVIASGVVYYPKSGKPRGVIEALSYNKNKFQYPSNQLRNMEVVQGMAGYVVLVSDQIGFGATDSMVPPYFYHDNVAKVCADLRQAATELVRNEYGRSMPTWTLISGFSLGASGAWALARYYHQHPELGVHVSEVWLSGGAYQPVKVLQHQLRTGQAEYAFIPNTIYAINQYDSLEIDLHEVFSGELAEHYEEWCTGRVALADLSQRLGPDISRYLNLDFFTESNASYQKLLASLERSTIPNDWIPDGNVHIYHGSADSYVPVSCSKELAAYLQSVGVNVDFVTTETDHWENGVAMGSEMAKLLYK